MKPRDLFDFVLLAALWGASFLFIRVGAPEFGPITLIGLRVLIAAICLWPLLWLMQRNSTNVMRSHAMPLAVVGVTNSALPFCLLAFASLSLTAGFTSLINASVPLWAALIGLVWLRASMNGAQWFGLALGVVGMVILTWGKVDFKPGGSGVAILAGLIATCSYGFSTHYAKRRLTAVPPLGVATGSQTAAAIVLLPLTAWFWPQANPSVGAWVSLILLGTFSTALAYILYFRLIAGLGGQKASTVTFLIPVFASLWGWVFLGETVTRTMLVGGSVVLLGTALTLGLLGKRSR
ncbi:MAG: EamA/RhaT family transporter [Betaproteobacteria bacterium]|nr:MAG: EamA/RhaT family transporter [Betaproteobacteria bacterium]